MNDIELDFYELMMNLGSAFFYGGFQAETTNEKEIQKTLEKYGFFFSNEKEVIKRRLLLMAQKAENSRSVEGTNTHTPSQKTL